jgi:hypothetical protein
MPFNSRDYFRLTGGSRNTIGKSGTNFNVSTNVWISSHEQQAANIDLTNLERLT